jgi:rod shape-determining protein MreC
MDSNYLRENILKLLGGIIICIFLILADGMGWLSGVYSAGNLVANPIRFWLGRTVEGVENVGLTVLDISNLRSENSELVIENAKLEAELENCKELRKQNEALKTQLDIDIEEDFELEMARVLGIDREGEAQHIIIDKGSDNGLEKGDPVVLGRILVGEVRDVFDSTSRVRLISNQNSNVSVISEETRAKGLLHGTLEGLVMEDILENEKIEEGNTIMVWSDDFPNGLVVGEVREVKIVPTSSTKEAVVQSPLNFEDLNYVFLITNY